MKQKLRPTPAPSQEQFYAQLIRDLAEALRDAVGLLRDRAKDLRSIERDSPSDPQIEDAEAREELRERAALLLRRVLVEGPR